MERMSESSALMRSLKNERRLKGLRRTVHNKYIYIIALPSHRDLTRIQAYSYIAF
jgi:hypothetical protein